LPAPGSEPATKTVGAFAVSALNAPIYTECARIWNPIHTDSRVAADHGLPAPVLHGTEILARAVSILKNDYVFVSAASIASVRCTFRGMVLPGMTLTVRASPIERSTDDWTVYFDVLTDDGAAAISGALTGSAARVGAPE
jgi:acyl dehydratase